MKVLFLAHRTPYPPNKGEKIRSYHILCSLAEKHEVSLLYWVDDPRDLEHAHLLREICRGRVVPLALSRFKANLRGLAALASRRSFSEGYFFSRKFQREVKQLLTREGFDFIYVFSAPMAQYVKFVSDIPIALDFVDVDSAKWGQLASFNSFPLAWLFLLEKKRLARYELATARRCRWSVFVTEAEAKLFRTMGATGNIVVLSNGVDADLCRLPVPREDKTGNVEGDRDLNKERPQLVFTGTMNYFPNVDAASYFVNEILPLVQRRYPNVSVDIVGRSPSRAVRKLGRVPGVRVLGEVDDIRPYLLHADVSVAPMRIARGIQNKILEAMAVGVPVVTTSYAATAIDVKQGEEVLIGDGPQDFALQVIRLLGDPKLRNQIARKARERVLQCYSWKNIGRQLENLIETRVETAQNCAMRNQLDEYCS